MRHRAVHRAALCLLLSPGGWAAADIDLEFREEVPVVDIGDEVRVGLYAVSDSATDQTLSVIEAVVTWDATRLLFTGVDATGAAPLLSSGFPAVGSGGLNEANPPQDGDAFYLALGPLGNPVDATPAGTLITTFVFEALHSGPDVPIALEASGGSPLQETVVYDGKTPNTVVTGALLDGAVSISCGPADLDIPFGQLNFDDVVAFLTLFGAMDPLVDYDIPFGQWDFSDVIAYLILFGQGCP